MMYRLVFIKGGREIYGRVEYETQEEAEARAQYFRARKEKVKVVPNSYFGLSK